MPETPPEQCKPRRLRAPSVTSRSAGSQRSSRRECGADGDTTGHGHRSGVQGAAGAARSRQCVPDRTWRICGGPCAARQAGEGPPLEERGGRALPLLRLRSTSGAASARPAAASGCPASRREPPQKAARGKNGEMRVVGSRRDVDAAGGPLARSSVGIDDARLGRHGCVEPHHPSRLRAQAWPLGAWRCQSPSGQEAGQAAFSEADLGRVN
ncbi:hypothetical protein HPB47_024806, partial [Ixodes persulcatus]